MPLGGGTGPVMYRKSWVNEVGYTEIPNDLEKFLDLCQKLQKSGHPFGMSLGHALGDANGFSEWLLWTHNAFVVDEKGKVALDSKETIAALKYATELQKTMIPGTLTWNDVGNNQAYTVRRDRHDLQRRVALLLDAEVAGSEGERDGRRHVRPGHAVRLSKRKPMTAAPISAMLFKHSKYPNAAKEYIRFMMEKDQYGMWLSSCLGYWCQPLKAYSKMKFWNSDPKLKPFAGGIGFAVLRWLQRADQRGLRGGDRQLHRRRHVRLRGYRRQYAGSGGRSRRPGRPNATTGRPDGNAWGAADRGGAQFRDGSSDGHHDR